MYDNVRRAADGGKVDVRYLPTSLFIERQVPLPLVQDPMSPWWALQHEKRDLLIQGNDPFIDFI